ncbi:HNH endonuclease, partial [Cytobacillus firmus]|nr:HNH endonuclease [Cytobacillus firmus]
MIYFPKSQPEPEDLVVERKKANGTYRTSGVLENLTRDFHNKCYICEYKNPTTINIEHFIPHKGDMQLKLDWNNLFLACSHCNNIKKENYDNILNCTNAGDEVENAINLSMATPVFTKNVQVQALKDDKKALLTAELLDKVYNGTTPMETIESHYIREELVKELLNFLN